ncbi:MAG: type II and III secretion system protein family protein [Phyllobacteriaceae bacterium]|nr:type II and III secretion system protein family protein [Phyllobacteriaceae bacterium]
MFASLVSPRRLMIAVAAAMVTGLCATAAPPAGAAEPARPERVASSDHQGDRVIHLALSKSRILDFEDDIRDVLVSDPKVADAVVRSSRRLYLIGNKFGTTNVVVFGSAGRPIANLEIQVEVDTSSLENLLKRLLPRSSIRVEAVAGTVILSGTVGSAAEAVQAYEVASRFIGSDTSSQGSTSASTGSGTTGTTTAGSSTGSGPQVVNALTIGGKDQVMLKVTIAEMQREVIKKLGIDVSADGGTHWANAISQSNPFPITSGTTPNSYGFSYSGAGTTVTAKLQALEQNSLMKTLAEPNLSALSGEQAQFLVGGEYPIPVSQSSGSSGNTIGIEFKTYGIALNFQPVVLAEDRINLTVKTEVSELTSDGAVTIGSLTVPALRVRRASTTLEIPSGGAMVLGGLIKDDVRQALAGTPGLMKLPILGNLFRSRDFQHSQSELVIFIQPVVVHPVAAAKLQRPDANFRPTGDASAIFMGRLNRVYRTNGQSPNGSYTGRVGYIFD